jgi:hypothetical protein
MTTPTPPDYRRDARLSAIVAGSFAVATLAVDKVGCTVEGYAGIAFGGAAFGAAVWYAALHERQRRVSAAQATSGPPGSLREIAEFVDAAAAGVLAEGHAAGVDAADRALDRVGDATTDMVGRATERRLLEVAFERNAAGQGA